MQKWFLNTSIATRLGLGFGALVLLIVIFGFSALQQMNQLEKQSDILYHHPFTVTRSVDAVVIEALKIHREMKDLAHPPRSRRGPGFARRSGATGSG